VGASTSTCGLLRRFEPAEDRQGERGGLAGAGLGLAEHVAAGQQRRDGGGLDRRRAIRSRPRNSVLVTFHLSAETVVLAQVQVAGACIAMH
jgi:hypothetical protein